MSSQFKRGSADDLRQNDGGAGASRPDVAERTMMGGLCFMVGGHMCCSVSGRGGLMVRVGSNAQDTALREPHVQPIEMAGRTMPGFVRIAPESLVTRT